MKKDTKEEAKAALYFCESPLGPRFSLLFPFVVGFGFWTLSTSFFQIIMFFLFLCYSYAD